MKTNPLIANNGHVTEAEFVAKMNELNKEDQTARIKEVFGEVDRDGDREISFIEFFTKLPTIMGCFDD